MTINKSKKIIQLDANNIIFSENLKNHIVDQYDESIIKKSSRHPNGKKQIMFYKSYFDDITEQTFRKLLDETGIGFYDDVISLDKLVNFLNDGKANNNNTKGRYQELIPFVIALYKLNIVDGLPDFSVLNKNIQSKIEPKRREYIICWWLKNQIYTDNFIKSNEECKNLCKVTYQYNIEDRYYDVYIEHLKILFEFHETGSAHLYSQNDELKRCLAVVNMNTIIYIIESEYEKDPIAYLKKLWDNDIKPSIYKELMKKSVTVRNHYCDYRFIQKLNEEILYFGARLENLKGKRKIELQQRIDKLNNIITKHNPENSMIREIFEWKEKSLKTNNKYVICINDIIQYTQFDDIDELSMDVELKYIYSKKEEKIYIDWGTLVNLINKNEKISVNQKTVIIKYLTSVQDIYEEIISMMLFRDDDKTKINKDMITKVINHIEQKKDEEYTPMIKRLRSKNESLEEQIKLNKHKVKNIVTISNKFIKNINNIKEKSDDLNELITELEKLPNKKNLGIKVIKDINKIYSDNNVLNDNIIKVFDKIKAHYNATNDNNIDIVKEMNQPIFKNSSIVYTGDPNDYVSYEQFEANCKVNGIEQREKIDSMCIKFYHCYIPRKTNQIHYVKYINNENEEHDEEHDEDHDKDDEDDEDHDEGVGRDGLDDDLDENNI